MSSALSFKICPGSDVSTISLFSQTQFDTQPHPIYLMYLSNIEKNGELVNLRPIHIGNADCLANVQNIVQNKKLVGVEYTSNGIYVRVDQTLRQKITANELKIEFQIYSNDGQKTKVNAKGLITLSDEGYNTMKTCYGLFLQSVREILATSGAQRQQADMAATNSKPLPSAPAQPKNAASASSLPTPSAATQATVMPIIAVQSSSSSAPTPALAPSTAIPKVHKPLPLPPAQAKNAAAPAPATTPTTATQAAAKPANTGFLPSFLSRLAPATPPVGKK